MTTFFAFLHHLAAFTLVSALAMFCLQWVMKPQAPQATPTPVAMAH